MGVQSQVQIDDFVNMYKARLVPIGYTHYHNIHYDEPFKPVSKMKTGPVLLAVAATKESHLYQMAVKNTFLQGEIQEQVYMVQPALGFLSGLSTLVV